MNKAQVSSLIRGLIAFLLVGAGGAVAWFSAVPWLVFVAVAALIGLIMWSIWTNRDEPKEQQMGVLRNAGFAICGALVAIGVIDHATAMSVVAAIFAFFGGVWAVDSNGDIPPIHPNS